MYSQKILLITIFYVIQIFLGLVYFYLIRICFDIKIIGFYGVLVSFFLILTFIFSFSFDMAHIKYYNDAKNTIEEAKCNGTFFFFKLIQLSVYIILILIFVPIIFPHEEDVIAIYVFFLARTLSTVAKIGNPIFLSKKQVFKKSLPLIISSLVRIILLIIFNFLPNKDIWLLVNIILISNILHFIITIFLLKNIKIKMPAREYMKKYLKYSYPFFFVASINILVSNIDVLIVNAFFPIEDVANYFTAKQIYIYSTLLLGSLTPILLSIFSKNISEDNIEKNLLIVKKIHKFLNILLIPVIFLIALYSGGIFVFLFGEKYRLTGLILTILFFNLIPVSIGLANNIHLRALGEVNFLAKISIIHPILTLILMVIFVTPIFLNMGAIGAAIATVFATIIVQIIKRPIIYKKYGLGFYWGSFRNITVMLGIFIFQLFVNELYSYPIYLVPIFILFNLTLYFIVNYLLKGFSKDDFRFILTVINIKHIMESISLEFKNKN